MSTSDAYEGTQFKSTQKWNDLIQYLYQHVDQKERKFKHKKCSCFTGTKAVSVLHEHVLKNHQRFNCSPSLPRENMLLLCQKFADQGLVVPAEHDNSSRVSFAFEDSSHAFYKFSDEACDICQSFSSSMEKAASIVKTDSEERKRKLEASSKQPSLKPLIKLNGNPTKRLFSMRESEKQKQQHPKGKPPIKQSSMRITKNFPDRFSSFRRKTSSEIQLLSAKSVAADTATSQQPVVTKSSGFTRSSSVRKSWSCKIDTAVRQVKRMIQPVAMALNSHHQQQAQPMLRWKPSHDLRTGDGNSFVPESSDTDIESSSTSSDDWTKPTCNRKRPSNNADAELEHSPVKLQRSHTFNSNHPIRSPRNLLVRKPPIDGRRFRRRNVDSAAVSQQDENGKVALSQNDLLRIRRQCVRVKLLQMIDLQFIDNLVVSPPSKNETKISFFASHKSNHQSKCGNKNCTEPELTMDDELVRSMFKLATMFATSNEIYDQHSEINGNVTSAKKIQLFFWIRDGLKKVFKNSSMFYSHLKEPIDEILLMIAEKPSCDTAKTLQLVIMLLDDNRIDQLKNTINFLKHLKQDETFQLSSKRSNFTVAMEELLPVIFPHCASLSSYKIRGERVESQQFATVRLVSAVELMMERERSLFEMPPDLAHNIDRQRQLVERELSECGEVENAATSLSIDNHFAQKVSVAEYERQKENFTQIQLQQLYNKLSSNKQLPHLTTARRNDIVKEMRKVHTDIATTSKGSPHVNKKRSVSSPTVEHPDQAASAKRETLI